MFPAPNPAGIGAAEGLPSTSSPVRFTDECHHVLKDRFSPQKNQAPNTLRLVTRNRRANIKSGKLFNTGKTAFHVHGTLSVLQPAPQFDDLFTLWNSRLENQRWRGEPGFHRGPMNRR